MKKVITLLLINTITTFKVISQISGYSVSSSSTAYTALSGGGITTHGTTANDDQTFNAINIGFTFRYNCTDYTQISISNNGFISFGASVSSSYTPISSGSSNNVVSALGGDLQGQAGSSLNTKVLGVAPNRIFVIEWTGYRSYGAAGDNYNFQIRLLETTNQIELHYGAYVKNATDRQIEAGLRGGSNADFNNRLVTSGTHTWATSVNGGANNSKCDLRTALVPASGLKFTYTPTALTYSSSNGIDQALGGNIEKCAAGVLMERLDIVLSGNCSPVNNVTNLTLTIGGTAPLTAISRVHIYYTGSSSTFSASNEFVSGGLAPAASLSFNDTRSVSGGTNYFWVVYDLSDLGAVGQTVTSRFGANSITINAVQRTPTAQPICSNTLIACSAYPTFSAWYKPNIGIVGNPVSQWTDQSATGFNLTQATAGRRPALISGATNYKKFNYNKRLNFVSASASSLGNISVTPDLLGASGTYFMVLQKGTTTGTSFAYDINSGDVTNPAYQFKPQFRCQSGNNGLGTTYDTYNAVNPSYPNYFNGDFPTDCAFINTSMGTNTTMTININGILDNTPDNSNNATYNPSLGNGLSIGNVSDGGAEPTENDVAEAILVNATMTSSQIKRIESYLAIKYGVTLGGNQNQTIAYNYFDSGNSVIFNKFSNAGYNRDITGIGRDDVSTLNQKQSISVNTNELVTIGLTTIASENDANAATFSSNKSFLIWGNNGGALMVIAANPLCFNNMPAGVQAKIVRVWRAQATNFSQTVTVGFETAQLVAYTPVSNLRLLVDNDGLDWTNATVYSGAVINGARVEFPGITINNTSPYFTLATIDVANTPLPIEIISFNGNCNAYANEISWETISETNNDYFEIERKLNGEEWELIGIVDGAGNSSNIIKYDFTDANQKIGIAYYRLKQIDFNGASKIVDVLSVDSKDCQSEITIYPNPATDEFHIFDKSFDSKTVHVMDITGRIVYQTRMNEQCYVDTKHWANGIYIIKIENDIYKLVIE